MADSIVRQKSYEHITFQEGHAFQDIQNLGRSKSTNIRLNIKDDFGNLDDFLQIITLNQPKCGRPTLNQARLLFGDDALQVKSSAIIPLAFTELEGVIAIGSCQEDRFHATMGHMFLTQMSEIVGTRLISLLTETDYD